MSLKGNAKSMHQILNHCRRSDRIIATGMLTIHIGASESILSSKISATLGDREYYCISEFQYMSDSEEVNI